MSVHLSKNYAENKITVKPFALTVLERTRLMCSDFFLSLNEELQAAVEEVLPSLEKDNVAVYYVSRASSTEGVGSLLDKVDEVSTEPIPESWRSEVTFSTPALYIYTSGTTGKNKDRLLKVTDLS